MSNDNRKSRRGLWLDPRDFLSFMSEQVMGVEPTLPAWEAGVLPIYDTCMLLYAGTYEIIINYFGEDCK